MNTKKNQKNISRSLMTLTFVFVSGLVTVSAQQNFVANLSGAQTVPAVTTNGRAVCSGALNAAQTQLSLSCNYSGLSSNASAAGDQ